ncbi:MAG: sodium:solute symporter family transporter [Methylomicrobium sp.]
MNTVLIGIIVYILLQLLVGVYCSRKIASESDYLLAGRSLGIGMGSLSVFATWFGAETCIGAAGSVYENGLSGATVDPFGYTLCLVLMGLVFATHLWRRNLTTLADLFAERYSAKIQNFAVILIAPTSIMWAAAQVRAFGQVLSSASGLEVEIAIAVAARRDHLYDVRRPAGRCGVLSQELVARVLASRTPEVARRSCVYGGMMYLAFGLIPVMIGLLGVQLLPGLTEPEQILPTLAQKYLHTFFYIIFAGALISAILSTVDSALLAASALLSHNLIVPVAKIQDDAAKVKVARMMVLVSGIIAFALALNAGRVYTLVEEASAFGSAGIFTVVIFGLFTSFGGVISAGVKLGAGMLTWIVGHHVLDLATPYLVSLAVALTSYIMMATWESVRAGNARMGLVASWLRAER